MHMLSLPSPAEEIKTLHYVQRRRARRLCTSECSLHKSTERWSQQCPETRVLENNHSLGSGTGYGVGPTSRSGRGQGGGLLHGRLVFGAHDRVVLGAQRSPQLVHDPGVELLVQGRLGRRPGCLDHVGTAGCPPRSALGLDRAQPLLHVAARRAGQARLARCGTAGRAAVHAARRTAPGLGAVAVLLVDHVVILDDGHHESHGKLFSNVRTGRRVENE